MLFYDRGSASVRGAVRGLDGLDGMGDGMAIERPGRPEDLPAAEVLWARWALVAVLEATAEAETRGVHRGGAWIDGLGLHLDDRGCTWWTFEQVGEGRYVLYGEDESSAVKWHEPAIDMLAQAPDWLPYERLRELLEGSELGCVYWYENGAWARAPYPDDLDDDGLDCGMSRFAVREEALRDLIAAERGLPRGRADGLLAAAEARGLTAVEIREVLDAASVAHEYVPADREAMLRSLDLATLTAPVSATPAPSNTSD
ncbi:hypothetical protein ACWCQL_29225 [Streptomyces sp. NPDC002073]|uniref:hypothetical protein n=1 Tax=Streptomyces sp. NBC_00239 TaxID=2903640 RepID=UPI002E2D1817|nr:hypothetical protein [Streptomyces sp. NBC_00239]